MRRFPITAGSLVAFVLLAAHPTVPGALGPVAPRLAAQDAAPHALGTVAGEVRDETTGEPLAGSVVLLLEAEANVTTGRLGRFVFAGVPEGRFHVSFHHPRLDELGIGPAAWEVEATAGDTTWVALSIPSSETVGRALCGGGPGVLVGRLRDEGSGITLPEGTVRVRWGETGDEREAGGARERSAVTDAAGRFALCDLPVGRELWIGGAFLGLEGGETGMRIPPGGTLVHDVRMGVEASSTVIGRVRATGTDEPVVGAEVRLAEQGRSTLTDGEGRFRLDGVTPGGDVLEVEHLAYGLARESIDVVPGSAHRLDLSLSSRAVELEGIEITARARRSGHMAGFERRMETGFGSYLTRDELERLEAVPLPMVVASRMTGFRVVCGRRTCEAYSARALRSLAGRGELCAPAVYLDGVRIPGFRLSDLSTWEVEAIEAYDSPATLPARFGGTGSACGVIIVWTRSGP